MHNVQTFAQFQIEVRLNNLLSSLTLLEAGGDIFETSSFEMFISPGLYELDVSNFVTFNANVYGSFWESFSFLVQYTKKLLAF